ncbi:MAG: hypothetical protein QW146_08480 [Candidatus Bathyarchaeia archaeon]
MESEVNIRYEPFKEIIILERTHFPLLEDLARFTSIVTGGKPGALYWADGVAFVYFPLSINTEATAKALIEEGKVYWAFLSYSLMPEYRPLVETREKIIIPVINMSINPLFQKVAKWLKEQHVQKP